MTAAIELLGPAPEEGLLMSNPSYDGRSAVDSGKSQALHAIRHYKRNLKPASPFSASGPSAYQLKPRLIAVRSPNVGLDVGNWRPLASLPKRISGPAKFVSKLLESWCLSRDDAVPLLGFDQKDYNLVQAFLAGAVDLPGRDVRDRIAHLLHIRATLASLFRDLDVENEWLRELHVLLDEREPLELLLGGSMEDLLLVKEYVDAAAGKEQAAP